MALSTPTYGGGTTWPLIASTWTAMLDAPNYVSVRATAASGVCNTLVDAFYVKKDTVVPPTPTVTGSSTSGSPELDWSPVTDVGSGTAYYRVWRSTTSGGTYTQVSTNGAPTTGTYSDGSAAAGTWYYKVQAVDMAGNVGALSAVTTVTTVATTPTLTWLSGFESGCISQDRGALANFVSTGAESPQVKPSPARNGMYALTIAKPSGTSANYVGISTSGNAAVARFAVRLSSLPTAAVTIAQFQAAAGAPGTIEFDPDLQTFTVDIGGAATASSVTVNPGTWYRFDVLFRTNYAAPERRVSWKIDDVAQTQVTASYTASATTQLVLGSPTAADVFTAAYDDVALSQTTTDYPIGDGKVLALRPDASGTHNNPASPLRLATNLGALDTSSHLLVDNSPLCGETGYIKQTTADAAAYAELSIDNTSEALNARGVRAIAAFTASNATANSAAAKIVQLDNTTIQTFFTGSTVSTGTGYGAALLTKPAAGWTPAEVNGVRARVGYASSVGSDPQFEAMLLEAEYPPSSGSISIQLDAFAPGSSTPVSAPASLSFGTVTPGESTTGEVRATITTDATNGYALSVADNDGMGAMTTPAGAQMPWITTGSIATPVTWPDTGMGIAVFGGSQTPSRWCATGQTCTTTNDSDLRWAPITATSTEITRKNAAAPSGDITRIPVRLSAPSDQQAGSYTGQFVVTVTAIP